MDEKVQTDGAEIFSALVKKNALIAEHSRRVSMLSVLIGRALDLTREEQKDLKVGGLLHDIGKLGVSQRVLEKPGRLNNDEFEHIKTHPMLGANFVDAVGYPMNIIDAVKYHHERLDGSGYPCGIKEDGIPLASRIIAVADVYEAMTANRPYRLALSVRQAFEELCQPKKYDQRVVQALRGALNSIELPEFQDLAAFSSNWR